MLTLTESAQKAVRRFIKGSDDPVTGLRVSVCGGGCSGMQYAIALEPAPKGDDVILHSARIQRRLRISASA